MAKREMKSQNVEVTEVTEETKVEQATAPEETPKEKEKKGSVTKGIVTGCTKLNIRKAPKADAPIVTVVDAGTELKIFDIEKANNGWYKVDKGYCMTKYVKLK